MRNALLRFAGAVALATLYSSPIVAHHGGAAFDPAHKVTFEGKVTEMQWANPHVLVFFDVADGEKAGENWSGWLTAPNKLARAGWTRKTLQPGDKITISGSPHREGNHILQISKLIGPDGKELMLFER